MEETILSKLKEEHREIQLLMLKVERCKDETKKQEIFEELKRVLLPHMEAEEETIYAHLKSDVHEEIAEEIADEAYAEHEEIKDALSLLGETEFGNSDWDEMFSDLKENIQMHFEDEEADLFTEAKEDFSREELIEFKNEFEEVKGSTVNH